MHGHHHVLGCGHRPEQADVLERAGHATGGDGVRWHAEHRLAVEVDVALRRRVQTGEHVEERGLAGAVGTDEGDDRAERDVEVDVVDGGEAAELHPHLTGIEQ